MNEPLPEGNNSKDRNQDQEKSIEFLCNNCLKDFIFVYNDLYMKLSGDIEFVPEPSCPRCGSRDDIFFSDYGQEQIEDMLFRGQIRRR